MLHFNLEPLKCLWRFLSLKNLIAQLRDNRNKPGLPVCTYTKLNPRKQYTLLGNLSSLPRISRGNKKEGCLSSYLSIYCNIAKDSEVKRPQKEMERPLFILHQPFNSLKGYVTELSKLYTGAQIRFNAQLSNFLIALDHSAPTVVPVSTDIVLRSSLSLTTHTWQEITQIS